MRRGEIVIVEIAYVERQGGKKRPAIIIQNNRDNQRLANTVVAMISGNVAHSRETTQLFIDPTTADGASSGLHGPSVVKCCNLFTVAQADVQHIIGKLSRGMMMRLEACLKAALELN